MKHTKLEKIEMLMKYAKSLGLKFTETWENEDECGLQPPMDSWDDMESHCYRDGVSEILFSIRISSKENGPVPFASKFTADKKDYITKSFDTLEEAKAWHAQKEAYQ